MSFKEELFSRLWKEKERFAFEQWIYQTNSLDFENCVGAASYGKIISENYSILTIREAKKFVLDHLSQSLKKEFKEYVRVNQKVLKAICIATTGLNYDGRHERDWELRVGKEYYILGISVNLKKAPHQMMFHIFDPSYSQTTPYLIPAELFEMNDSIMPPDYAISVVDNTLELGPCEFTDKHYAAVEYSFWEDYFDDHEKAVTIFKATIDRLGIELDEGGGVE